MRYIQYFTDMDIFKAIKKQNIDQVKSIFSSQNIDIDAKKSGQTPLLIATVTGNPNIIKILLDLGADVNIRSSDVHRKTALHLACKYCEADGVELLIRSGADVDAQDHYGNTPLYKACTKGRLDIIKVLVQNGANVNQTNSNHSSALHAAAANGFQDIVRYLLEFGCDKLIKNKNGDTPQNYALKNKHTETARLIGEFNLQEHERKLSERKVSERKISTGSMMSVTYVPSWSHTPTRLSCDLSEVSETLDMNFNNQSMISLETSTVDLKAIENKLATLDSSRADVEQILQADTMKLKKSKEALKQAENDLKNAALRCQHTETELTNITDKISQLQYERDAIKQDLYEKNKVRTQSNHSVNSDELNLYECPLCLEIPLPPLNIFQCEQGHIYCEKCKAQGNMKICPQCRVSIDGLSIRCRHMEDLILKKFL